MVSLFDVLFGCSHKKFSFPITRRRSQRLSTAASAASVTGTYVVCLDCGKEFAYDWQKMKIVSRKASQSNNMQPKQAKAA